MEWVDVVDEQDRVIGTVTRAEMRARRLRHRAVFIAVVHPGDGSVLVHQRSAAKDLWPSRWDVAVGGVVGAGETYAAAARRELAEEIGIAADPVETGAAAYADDDVSLVARCYRVQHGGPFTFADGEVVAVRWLPRAELDAFVGAHPFVPDSLALAELLLG